MCTRPTPSLAYCTATIFSVKVARAARCPAPDAPAVFTAYFGAIQCHTKRNWAPGSRPHIGHHNKTRYNSKVQLAVSGTARNEIGPLAAGRTLDTTTKQGVAVSGVQSTWVTGRVRLQHVLHFTDGLRMKTASKHGVDVRQFFVR